MMDSREKRPSSFPFSTYDPTGLMPTSDPSKKVRPTGRRQEWFVKSTDVNGGALTYHMVNGWDAGGRFQVHPTTGVVTVANSSKINREDASRYLIRAYASDGNLASSGRYYYVYVTNVAPSTPSDINGAANSVVEGAGSNTLVGITARSTDPNGTRNGGGVSYSLANSAGNRFKIHSSTGVVSVRTPSLITTSRRPAITSRCVLPTASQAVIATKVIHDCGPERRPLYATDVNTSPNRVAEAATTGTTVGLTARSSDPNGPAPAYRLTDDADGRFQISAVKRRRYSKGRHEAGIFEDAMSHAVTVEAGHRCRKEDGLIYH